MQNSVLASVSGNSWGRGCCGTFNLASSAQTQVATSGISGYENARAQFSESELARVAINAGSFPDLRWPDFSDDSTHWINSTSSTVVPHAGSRGMEPTTPARQIIALMLQAHQKAHPVMWQFPQARFLSCLGPRQWIP